MNLEWESLTLHWRLFHLMYNVNLPMERTPHLLLQLPVAAMGRKNSKMGNKQLNAAK